MVQTGVHPRMVDAAGINVIGHVSGNLGMGVSTRQVIDLIERQGRPVAVFDVDLGTQRERAHLEYDRLARQNAADLPYRINLFVLGLGALDWALKKCPDRFFDGDYLNAIVCFWELPVISTARTAHLDRMDVVIGASDFLRHVFQQSLAQATVIGGLLPLTMPPPLPFDRGSLGIGPEATVFVFSFDPASDSDRKNPWAVIRAFRKGVGQHDQAYLLIKINNAHDKAGVPHEVFDRLKAFADGHPRIVFLTAPMSYAQVLGLYRACDVYVSLHRAEGYGLGMAEAMTLGLPVIATGWSGNMTFMRQTTACLVRYRLVPVRGSIPAYREPGVEGVARWAEPDVDQAAAFMAHLHAHPAARQAIGSAAAEALRAINASALRGEFIDELDVLYANRSALAKYGYVDARVTGRPELRLPPPPIRRRLGDAWSRTSQRIVDKTTKMLRGAPRRTTAARTRGE